MHTRYIQVGGVFEDIPPGWEKKCREFLKIMPTRLDQYEDLLDRNEIWLERLKDTGVISQERALELGVTGPLLRATGHPWDLRKAMPYSSTSTSTSRCPVGHHGDNYDRFRVRMDEMRESLKIVEQALDGLPEGPYITDNRKVALPPRHELATSMEALIHHFKLVTEGFRVPPGEAYVAIESPRGELGCYVLADGSAKPARVHMRDPSFVNLQSLPEMAQDSLIADFIACVAMLDPIIGGGGPVSALLPPGWDEAVRLDEDPATIPDPADRRRPARAARRDRALHGEVPRPPLGHAAGAGRGPARARLVLARGDPAGGRGDAGHARLPVERRHLLRHAAHPSGRAPLRLRVHQRRLPPAQRQGRLRRDPRAGRRAGARGRRAARVRVPRRLRHGADGVDRRPLRRPAHRARRGRARVRA